MGQNLICEANVVLSVHLCYLVCWGDALSQWVKGHYLSTQKNHFRPCLAFLLQKNGCGPRLKLCHDSLHQILSGISHMLSSTILTKLTTIAQKLSSPIYVYASTCIHF